ncbi:MAG: LysM peptidoglycan-binding domain-containing protein [Alicyclobacillus sp.]|nr:LysM peptidoglycan-binding domain-containing protein [Alicyclobacillus sp.]
MDGEGGSFSSQAMLHPGGAGQTLAGAAGTLGPAPAASSPQPSSAPPHLHDIPTSAGSPTAAADAAPEAPPFFGFVWPHVVQPGETWASIQERYRVPRSQLERLNPSLATRELRPGDLVYVPGMVPPADMAAAPSAYPPATTAPPTYPSSAYPGSAYPGQMGGGPFGAPYSVPMVGGAPGMVPYAPQPYAPYAYGMDLPHGVNPAEAADLYGPHQHHPYRDGGVDASAVDWASSWESTWEGTSAFAPERPNPDACGCGDAPSPTEPSAGYREWRHPHPSWPEPGSSQISVYLGDEVDDRDHDDRAQA